MTKEEIDSKLLDYLLHVSSEKECLEVEAWLEGSETNKRYFQAFRQSHDYILWGNRAELIRGDFSIIRKRIYHRLFIHRISTIAALIILLTGIAVGLWMGLSEEKFSVTPAFVEQIHPGGVKAMLYLSSGKMIPLSIEKEEIQEEDGICVPVNEGGIIYYDSLRQTGNQSMIHRICVPKGGEFQLVLADGSKVWLNSNSEIIYPIHFEGKDRVIRLKGEAYFEVVKDNEHPFIVEVDEIAVKVYGTKFNINSQKQGFVETVLVEGSVGIKTPHREILLKPNQKGLYVKNEEEITVETVDVTSFIAWKDGNFVFHDESLDSIMEKLALWYDVNIFYANDEARKIRLSGDMVRYKEVQNLLYFFERISNVHFQIEGKTIIVSCK